MKTKCAAPGLPEGLIESGFKLHDDATGQLVERWRGLPRNAFLKSRSVDYLRRSGQLEDLDFILKHFDDVNIVCQLSSNEIVDATAAVAAGRL